MYIGLKLLGNDPIRTKEELLATLKSRGLEVEVIYAVLRVIQFVDYHFPQLIMRCHMIIGS
jgi:hypothetical protein